MANHIGRNLGLYCIDMGNTCIHVMHALFAMHVIHVTADLDRMHDDVRIDVVARHACKGVVDVSMVCLVDSNLLDHVEKVGVIGKSPISLGNLRCRQVTPARPFN